MNFAQSPIWAAALISAGCKTIGGAGECQVRWEAAPGHLRYMALGCETVQPFGVSLNAGEVLEVRWPDGETDYTLQIRLPARAA